MEPAESVEPERPAGLPESGIWNPSLGKWEVSPRGADGAPEGERLLYRPDGRLFSRTRLVGGVPEGPFAIYHPDGSVAREGRYAAGRFDGLITAYASDAPGSERLRSCCVPPGAARHCERYQGGDFLSEIFYDRQGRALLSDGRLCPPRPASIPELAQFEEARVDRTGWALHGRLLDRFWTVEGELVEEVERAPDGSGRVVRLFDGAGRVCEESGFSVDHKRQGAFMRRLAPEARGSYADARVRQERGGFELGQAVGVWTFHDADGALLRQIDRGLPFAAGAPAVSPAFADPAEGEGATLEHRWALARRLLAERRVREALCATARAAVHAADRAALTRFLAEHVLALAPDAEPEQGDPLAGSGDADVATILDALMLGADAATAFRALGGALPGTSSAAADFVEASLLLAPERAATHLTRALLRVERGDEPGARAALAVVEADRGALESVRVYLRLVFRPFELDASRVVDVTAELARGDPPVAVAQSLEAIQRLVGVYATRLARVRAAIRALLARDGRATREPAHEPANEPAWLPPDVSSLLPEGPIPLRRESIACDPEDGTAGEPETLEIDERLETEGLGVPALLGLAQADFGALGWLCWSIGLDRIAMPGAISPRAGIGAAIQMMVNRHWRASDRLATGGLLAMKHAVPGFSFQGVDIDLLPLNLVPGVTSELLATRSMFLWLVSPGTLSPFQDDIRDA